MKILLRRSTASLAARDRMVNVDGRRVDPRLSRLRVSFDTELGRGLLQQRPAIGQLCELTVRIDQRDNLTPPTQQGTDPFRPGIIPHLRHVLVKRSCGQ